MATLGDGLSLDVTSQSCLPLLEIFYGNTGQRILMELLAVHLIVVTDHPRRLVSTSEYFWMSRELAGARHCHDEAQLHNGSSVTFQA